MTRRIVIVVAWGLAGLAIAGGLIAGAFALAGEDIGQPATPPPPSATATKGPGGDDTRSPEAEHTQTRTTEPGDDHGGNGNEPGDDHGGGTETRDDHGGSSNSGSGSDASGSGSSNSGSGSDSSGSGSGSDDHGDD
jgi:hypothetical protein